MKLILRLADHDTDTGQSRTLETGRLSIGRGADNDWVLADPDRTLSKNHCRIDASEGGFMLTDMSTNGVFLAGSAQPIGRGHSCALEDGDSFAIGPYRLAARIADTQAATMGAGQGLGLPQAEVDAIFLGGGTRPGASPIAASLPDNWVADMPSGGFGPERRAAPQGWDAPPDPATYAATGLFEAPTQGGGRTLPDDPFADAPNLFSQHSEHIGAASTVMRLPEAQVVLPTDWMDTDPMEPAAAPGPAQPPAATWPPALPEEPPPPPSLPADWVVADPLPAEPAPFAFREPPPPQAATPPPLQAPPVLAPILAPVAAPDPPPVFAAPKPTPRPSPARPAAAVPPPAPAREPAPEPAPAGPATADQLLRAFLDGAGLPAETLDGIEPEGAMREIGQMVRAAVEGVRDIMSTRALVKSEFRVDQTVLRRSDNNAVKFAPDAQRCLAAMVGAAPPGFLPGPAAMRQSMDDIKRHELSLVAALNSVFADMGQLLDPEAIMRRARQDTSFATMLPYAREAKCWAIYMENHHTLQDSGAANTGGSLLAPLAQAYARQLRRGG